jgi:alkanesulfonate monooxygenase SsuD/methylene tetrahydromethanopterin reductase-like flavin-dependent oxidoreductase (luciferase family)
VAFYATTLTYDAILDLHGWQAEKEGIRAAWKKFDVPAMSAAVSDEMLEQIAVAGTAEECREQLARYDGLLDHVLLYPPSFGTRPERVKENYRLIMETFAPAHARARSAG